MEHHGSPTLSSSANCTGACALGASLSQTDTNSTDSSQSYALLSYASQSESQWLLIVHLTLMLFASLIVLPLALFLRRSKYRNHSWVVCTCISLTGAAAAILHRGNTEDLYRGAIHRRSGLILILAVSAYTTSLIYQWIRKRRRSSRRHNTHADSDIELLLQTVDAEVSRSPRRRDDEGRQDNDSTRSSDTLYRPQSVALDRHSSSDGLVADYHSISGKVIKNSRLCTNSVKGVANTAASIVILAAVYVQILLGIATYCGLFKGHAIYNGLAHWIKASVFFLFGIWVFTRYLGAFESVGHAWNLARTADPISAETIECGLIFTYGVSNLFLERLGHSDEPVSHTDIQHLCIAAMFAFGGFIGLLLESKTLQRLLSPKRSEDLAPARVSSQMSNIMPALVVFFTGLLMSQHHQDSQLSSAIHATWGYFFCTASLLRILTYIMQYISPPSRQPGRPPTEALVAFSLIAGSFVFMLSARDSVQRLEILGIDLMVIVSIGVAGSLGVMAWTLYVAVLSGIDKHRVRS